MITTVTELAAEALFVSDLQPSDRPCRDAVERAVTAMILRHGSDGCAAGVAAEFGDHPESAVRRMCWARGAVHAAVTGGAPAPGPDPAGGAVAAHTPGTPAPAVTRSTAA